MTNFAGKELRGFFFGAVREYSLGETLVNKKSKSSVIRGRFNLFVPLDAKDVSEACHAVVKNSRPCFHPRLEATGSKEHSGSRLQKSLNCILSKQPFAVSKASGVQQDIHGVERGSSWRQVQRPLADENLFADSSDMRYRPVRPRHLVLPPRFHR